ncbi:MAG TPA: methyltransferase domain-containing protein [Terriglobia bacterium]|nr:methyltransferase domain-containing protein [Terriglobia bacterium]
MSNTPAAVSKLDMLRELGFFPTPDATVLDFGCGSGGVVRDLRSLGYQAYGCDLEFKNEPGVNTDEMLRNGILRRIDQAQYLLPFEDNTFQAVISDQVFEHVQDYALAVSEIARVLRPGGASINVFPARYAPIEPHVGVPLATVVQSRWWLRFWALLGRRAPDQQSLLASQVAADNYTYLKNKTNYLPKRAIAREFESHFHRVRFSERLFLKHSQRGRRMYALSSAFPFIPWMYSAFRARVVLAAEPVKPS